MVLGGTSAIDSMEHIRGSQHIFNEWEQSGATGWNFTDVKDFFKMAEDVNIKRVPLTSTRFMRATCILMQSTQSIAIDRKINLFNLHVVYIFE